LCIIDFQNSEPFGRAALQLRTAIQKETRDFISSTPKNEKTIAKISGERRKLLMTSFSMLLIKGEGIFYGKIIGEGS
jgi:hypothetical protein